MSTASYTTFQSSKSERLPAIQQFLCVRHCDESRLAGGKPVSAAVIHIIIQAMERTPENQSQSKRRRTEAVAVGTPATADEDSPPSTASTKATVDITPAAVYSPSSPAAHHEQETPNAQMREKTLDDTSSDDDMVYKEILVPASWVRKPGEANPEAAVKHGWRNIEYSQYVYELADWEALRGILDDDTLNDLKPFVGRYVEQHWLDSCNPAEEGWKTKVLLAKSCNT